MPRGWLRWASGVIYTHVALPFLFCVRKTQCIDCLLNSLLGRRVVKVGIAESSSWGRDKATQL